MPWYTYAQVPFSVDQTLSISFERNCLFLKILDICHQIWVLFFKYYCDVHIVISCSSTDLWLHIYDSAKTSVCFFKNSLIIFKDPRTWLGDLPRPFWCLAKRSRLLGHQSTDDHTLVRCTSWVGSPPIKFKNIVPILISRIF